MQQIDLLHTHFISGGMHSKDFDSLTKKLYRTVKASLQESLIRLESLEDPLNDGYACFTNIMTEACLQQKEEV